MFGKRQDQSVGQWLGLGLGKWIGLGLELWLGLGLAHSLDFLVAPLFHNYELLVSFPNKRVGQVRLRRISLAINKPNCLSLFNNQELFGLFSQL